MEKAVGKRMRGVCPVVGTRAPGSGAPCILFLTVFTFGMGYELISVVPCLCPRDLFMAPVDVCGEQKCAFGLLSLCSLGLTNKRGVRFADNPKLRNVI